MKFKGHTFVSLGNGNQPFDRLIEIIELNKEKFPHPIIVQHGKTKITSSSFVSYDFLGEEDFFELLQNASCFITHGGVGSILSAIKIGVKAIVLPRERKFNEVVDDHQLEFVRLMKKKSYVVGLEEFLTSSYEFPIKLLRENCEEDFLNYLQLFKQHSSIVDPLKICLVCSNGGHLREILQFQDYFVNFNHFYVLNGHTKNVNVVSNRHYILTLFERDLNFFRNIIEAFRILKIERPNLIITTGAGIAVPFALVAKFFNIKVFYLETMAKVDRLSLTGHFMKFLSTKFFVPYNNMRGAPKKSIFIGVYF